MTITLTTDPIITVSDLQDLLNLDSETKAIVLINSVSRKFLNYTQRSYINQAAAPVTELYRGAGTCVIWLRAYATDVTQVEFLDSGSASSTFTSDDYAVDADGPRITFYNTTAPRSDAEDNISVTYTPGWAAIPGDIIFGAIEQIIYERARLAGKMVGMTSESQRDHTASYEIGGLIKSARDAWQPYVIMR